MKAGHVRHGILIQLLLKLANSCPQLDSTGHYNSNAKGSILLQCIFMKKTQFLWLCKVSSNLNICVLQISSFLEDSRNSTSETPKLPIQKTSHWGKSDRVYKNSTVNAKNGSLKFQSTLKVVFKTRSVITCTTNLFPTPKLTLKNRQVWGLGR